MKTTELLLFDLGGVVIELTGVPRMLEWTNGRYDEKTLWDTWTYSPSVRLFETGKTDAVAFARGMVEEYKIDVSPEQFLSEFTLWPKALFPGSLELLAGLKKRLPTASLSNTNVVHWFRYMEELDIEALFSRNFPSHLTGLLKPDAEAFAQVIHQCDVLPEEIVYFDDNPINVSAAKTMGMKAFHVKGVPEVTACLTELRLV